MSEELKVLLHGEEVGVLARDKKPNSARFSYLTRDATPISVALPPEKESFNSLDTKNWFEGLLPEGEQRKHMEARFKVERGDYFSLLREIGWECAGAISVVPVGYTADHQRYHPVDEDGIRDRLANLPRHAEIPDDEVRLSLGGFQAKLLVAQINDQWFLPLNGAPSTHILKPSTDKEPFIADAEAWALHIAGSVTEVPVSRVHDFGGIRCMISQRYDRVPDSAAWFSRIHQEDFAQALLIHPDDKYARDTKPSSPNFQKLAQILIEHSNDPDDQVARLLRQNVVNVMIGNIDNHAKNYGLIHDKDGSVTLSPQYDVVTAKHYTPYVTKMGMPINGKLTWGRIERDDLIAEGRNALGIPYKKAVSIVDTAIIDFMNAMSEANEKYPECPRDVKDAVAAYSDKFNEATKTASKMSLPVSIPKKAGSGADTGDLRCHGVVKSKNNAPCILLANHRGFCRSV